MHLYDAQPVFLRNRATIAAQLSPKARRALEREGFDRCWLAYEFQRDNRRAANHPSFRAEFGMSTAQATAAINAGRELAALILI